MLILLKSREYFKLNKIYKIVFVTFVYKKVITFKSVIMRLMFPIIYI